MFKNKCKQCGLDFIADEEWKTICKKCYIKSRNGKFNENKLDNEDMLKKIIYLCHPDKHNNSEMSKIVSQYLQSEKNKRK